jgi:hypothetical protein
MMADNPFLTALNASVGRARAAFDEADADLHAAVAEASKAVQDFSGGKLSLGLDATEDGVEGRQYDLDLVGASRQSLTVAGFFVPQGGYPIRNGVSEGGSFEIHGYLGNSEQIRDYLLGILSDPDSRLTVGLAFQLRQRRK